MSDGQKGEREKEGEVMEGILALIILVAIGMVVKVIAEGSEKIPPEYKQCHGCLSGWCDCEPGSEECRKWRKYADR